MVFRLYLVERKRFFFSMVCTKLEKDKYSLLPDHYWVLIEIGDVGPTNTFWILLHDHPAKVGVKEAFAD